MRLLVVPPSISLADGDEFFWWGVQRSRKGLVRFYITDLRFMRWGLPVLVWCDGGHITDRFDGFWAAPVVRFDRCRAAQMALLLGALFAKL